MPIKRIFLSIERPALQLAGEFLIERFADAGRADLRGVVAVLPGGRAGRRLTEILVDLCDQRRLVLTPPTITTPKHLPELLYQPQRPFADELVQQIAWANALRGVDEQLLRDVIPRHPAVDATTEWLELGKMLQLLHRELASDDLNFDDVRKLGANLPGFNEARRWSALAHIQREYLRQLDQLGLWDRQTARLVAIERHECETDKHIVLIGAADMNRTMRLMLDQVAEHVTALIYAPRELERRFDSHGCVEAKSWSDAAIDIAEEKILRADDPADQADRVARTIAGFDGRYRAEEITIGLPDERIVPQLERQLDACGLPNRFGPGRLLTETGPYRLLAAVADLLESNRFQEFAALARHPDMQCWIEQQGIGPAWLIELDAYYNDHLPGRIDEAWRGGETSSTAFRAAGEKLRALLCDDCGLAAGEVGDSLPRRPLHEWTGAWLRFLGAVYGGRTLNLYDAADRATHAACNKIQSQLAAVENVPAALMPQLNAPDTIRLVLSQIASERSAAPAEHEAIELVGWLELPLDDAPAVIVTGLNEGFVPQSVNADLFLPNALRRGLNLDDNERRYARDAYALSVLLAPWRDVTLIVPRRNVDGDPLAPSRLLFACDETTIAARALDFFAPPKPQPPRPPLAGTSTVTRNDFGFSVPRPLSLAKPFEHISVTAFRSYLSCPYRFYLSHVLKLSRVDDEHYELDGGKFGDLAHKVLQKFAESDESTATESEPIERCLNYWLNRLIAGKYGKSPLAAIQIQAEQLRLRLLAFAAWQAKWAAQGWQIEHTEKPAKGNYAPMEVDGQMVQLSGRIDRIDVNRDTGQRMLLDYKTSDAGHDPEQAHRKRKSQWIDLQLPLYRHLAKTLGVDGDVRMGYILLPKDVDRVGDAMANWSAAELDEADEVARDVVRKIRRQEFWPPQDPPPDFSEDFAYICLDGVFGKPVNN